MGSTFVTFSRELSVDMIGFWMRDSVLELWLRLLALHVPEPQSNENSARSYIIRNQWLLASLGCFNGCVPHELEEVAATAEGRGILRAAVGSLLAEIRSAPPHLNRAVLNLLGMQGHFNEDFPTARLVEVGVAFEDLLDGKLTCTVASTEFMPGCR